ncbi:MAG: hypothetical protein KDA54_03550 [Phycisphaerales bacterium]|nr:hypothetical protein [Phycisphaerales bacterium]
MEKLRSYILAGLLAAAVAIPASAWHNHHDDGDHHGGPDESCPVCYVVKAASTAVATSAPVLFIAEVSWAQCPEPAQTSAHRPLPTGQPRAPPHLS